MTALLARCARVRSELDALRTGHGQLLDVSARLRQAHEAGRRQRAHDVTATATLLSALVEQRRSADTDAASSPRGVPMPPSHGCAA